MVSDINVFLPSTLRPFDRGPMSKRPPLNPTTRYGLPAWAGEAGAALRRLRKLRGLNQSDAATLVGKAASRISDLECGIVADPRLYLAYAAKLDAILTITFGPDAKVSHTLTFKEKK